MKLVRIWIEITEVILVYCNSINNNYEQNSRVLVANKSFGELLDILQGHETWNGYTLKYFKCNHILFRA